MKQRRRIFLWIGCVFVVSVVLMALALTRREAELPDFLNKPAENAAYSELLAATTLLVGDPSSIDARPKIVRTVNGKTVTETNRIEQRLGDFVAQNGKPFDAVERLLNRPVDAPVSNYVAGSFSPMMFVAPKTFSRALAAKGRLAECEKRYGDAARAYFDGIRLGEKIEHGPMINFLVGAAIERGGIKRMEGLMTNLSTTELRVWAREIQALNRERISFEEILRREHYFMARNATNIVDALRTRFFSRKTTAIVDGTGESHANLRAQLEVLAATMAGVCYARENGGEVTNAAGLAPKYLKSAPVDPYGEKEETLLSMVMTTNGPVFYSVGKNRIDEAGKGDDVAIKYEDGTAYRVMFRAMSAE